MSINDRGKMEVSHYCRKAEVLTNCFHSISSWCLHYWAILTAHIEHRAVLCCSRSICWIFGYGSKITAIFHASHWCLKAIKLMWLSYWSQGLWNEEEKALHQKHQQQPPYICAEVKYFHSSYLHLKFNFSSIEHFGKSHSVWKYVLNEK